MKHIKGFSINESKTDFITKLLSVLGVEILDDNIIKPKNKFGKLLCNMAVQDKLLDTVDKNTFKLMIDCNINKKLNIGDKISFIINNTLLDGTIEEKNDIGKGDIEFIIQTKDGKCRIKHRRLDLYYTYL